MHRRAYTVLFPALQPGHHSIAFAPCMPDKFPRLPHIMLEVGSLDDVMRSYRFLRIRGAPIGMGTGAASQLSDQTVSVQTPAGFAVEFGRGHPRLDDAAYQPMVYPSATPVDLCGGDVQSSEFELA